MCGRYTLATDTQKVAEHFRVLIPDALFGPRFNIAPSQPVPVVFADPHRDRQLQLMTWGLVPPWSTDDRPGPINARAETAATQPLFRAAFRARRCLLPADGFYEWAPAPPPAPTPTPHACGLASPLFDDPAPPLPKPKRASKPAPKQPHLLRLHRGALFAFAGLYERKANLTTVTILTTAANALLAPLHHRMPVILPPTDYDAWLDPAATDPGPLQHLLRPFPPEPMTDTPVSRTVNSPRHDSPDCIAPLVAPTPSPSGRGPG